MSERNGVSPGFFDGLGACVNPVYRWRCPPVLSCRPVETQNHLKSEGQVSAVLQGLAQGSAETQHLRALAGGSSEAIFITNFDSAKFLDANARACLLFGYTVEEFQDMTGRQLHDSSDGATVDSISRELLEHDCAHRASIRLRRKDGTYLWGELNSTVYQLDGLKLYVAFVRDVTERRAAQQKLNATTKALGDKKSALTRSAHLATVGQVASSVVHEVNNPATSLQMNLEVLSRRLGLLESMPLGPDFAERRDRLLSDARANISESLLAVTRIAETMRGLRSFARLENSESAVIELNEVVRAAVGLVGSEMRQTAKLTVSFSEAYVFVGNRDQWLQVVVNLLLNAGQSTRNVSAASVVVQTGETVEGGVLEVSDNGPGVASEHVSQVFEPFFTTRGKEGATGLGLSLCADVVRQHGARIELVRNGDAEVAGACFRVTIPRSTQAGKHT